MSIGGWIVNAVGAIIMLYVFVFMGAMVVMRIRENKNDLNTIPKLLKAIGKLVGQYIIYLAISLLLILILWIISYPPYPYRAFIGCFLLGLIVGYFLGFNTKK